MRTTTDIIKLFRVNDQISIIKEKMEILKKLENTILEDNGFYNKNTFKSLCSHYNEVMANETFTDEDLRYIKSIAI